MDAFAVVLDGEVIDTVYYTKHYNFTADEVRKSLVDHDCLDPRIEVRKLTR